MARYVVVAIAAVVVQFLSPVVARADFGTLLMSPAELKTEASKAYEGKDYARAAGLWAKYVEGAPDDVRAWGGLTMSYYHGGQYEKGVQAAASCASAAKTDQKRAACMYNLGLCYEKLGRIADARSAWEGSLALRPNKTVSRRLARLGTAGFGTATKPSSAREVASAYLKSVCPGARLESSKFGWSVVGGAGCSISGLAAVQGAFTTGGADETIVLVSDFESEGGGYAVLYTSNLLILEKKFSKLDGLHPGDVASFHGSFRDKSGRDIPVLCTEDGAAGGSHGSCCAVRFGGLTREMVLEDVLFSTRSVYGFDGDDSEEVTAGGFRWKDTDGDGGNDVLTVQYRHVKTVSGRKVQDRKYRLRFELRGGRVVPTTPVPRLDVEG